MGLTEQHVLYAVEAGAAMIGGIGEQSLALGTDTDSQTSNAELYARIIPIRSQSPKGAFLTKSLTAALTVVGSQGADIAALAGGLKLFMQKTLDAGGRAGAGSHMKYTIVKGMMVPGAITVEHQDDAALPVAFVATYDGSNAPVVGTQSVSLPSGADDSERFTIGKVVLAGITVDHVTGIELDFGLSIEARGSDSDIWPTFVYLKSVNPTVTIRVSDPTVFDAAKFPILGKAGAHADTTIYLRKRLNKSTFVADGTAEHIKFTVDCIVTPETLFDATGNDPAGTVLKIGTRYDGTNAPVVVTLNTAIT